MNYKMFNKANLTEEQIDRLAEQIAYDFLIDWLNDDSTSFQMNEKINNVIKNYKRTNKNGISKPVSVDSEEATTDGDDEKIKWLKKCIAELHKQPFDVKSAKRLGVLVRYLHKLENNSSN